MKSNKHNSNNRRRNKRNQGTGLVKMARQINLHNPAAGCTIQVGYPILVWAESSTSSYSFSNGIDVRYLAFAQILSTTYPFADFSLVYQEYKISAAAAIVTSVDTSQTLYEQLGPLYLTADPEINSSTAPTNSTLIASQNSKIFSHRETDPRSVQFRFNGVGVGSNIWSSVNTSAIGGFFIGQDIVVVPSNVVAWSCILTLTVHFRDVRSH